MTKKQMNKEYAKIMLKAEAAVGRKEAMSLFKEARLIRKKIHHNESSPPLHQGN